MGWKDWSYWLKGGIVGLIIVLILIIFFGIGFLWFSEGCGEWCLKMYGSSFIGTVAFISILSYYYIIPTIILLGIIIGYIIGKIKSRNK